VAQPRKNATEAEGATFPNREEALAVPKKNGSSGRTRTLKPIRKSNPVSNLLKILSRTILRFRRIRLLRGNLVRKVVQTGTKQHEHLATRRDSQSAVNDRHHH